MQEAEMKIIPSKQSVWWKIGGWLPVVVVIGIFLFFAFAIQSIESSAPSATTSKNGSGDVVSLIDWIPFGITMIIVIASMVVAWLRKEKIKKSQWWVEKKKDADDIKWFWYTIVLIVTITASAVAPSEHRYTVAMVIALLGLHVVWLQGKDLYFNQSGYYWFLTFLHYRRVASRYRHVP